MVKEVIVYETEDELMIHAKMLEGKTFYQIDTTGRIADNKGKGRLGQIIEESHFGYNINSRAEADFKNLNIELKVTPYRRNKNGSYSAKERLVLNVIDYMTEVDKTFYTSSFWTKNKKLLLVFYKYDEGKQVGDYKITNTILFQIPDEDLPTIMNDWKFIVNKIRMGKAHELSEGDTFYLGACPKGKDRTSLRPQPFSDESAMQRAFTLKQGYMTSVLRKYVLGQNGEKLIKDTRTTIEKYIDKMLKPLIGLSFDELCDRYNQVADAKNSVQLLMSKIFGIQGTDLSKIEEFEKANIKLKTIRLEKDNKIIQSMSFPTFKFKEIINIPWEESDLKMILGDQKYLFIVFKKDENGKLIFKGYKFWNMPYEDLKEVQKVYEKTVDTVRKGVIIEDKVTKKGIIKKNNLPGMSENEICHVRPHGRDGEDKYELPDGRWMTKQCFWLNNTYVYKQIENLVELSINKS